MAANTLPGPLEVERTRSMLLGWFERKQTSTVALEENLRPKQDEFADYTVVYEARFQSSALDQAQVELWIARDGDLAIGFETTSRIAQRLAIISGRSTFAAGHEPALTTSEAGLLHLLELVADGRVAIWGYGV